jgi:tRNA uridine 5-carboxymethylaminomethyl modification enzyme
MFTSRAEYRILLRQDNADERLTKKSNEIGLATAERVKLLETKEQMVASILDFVTNFSIKADRINPFLEQVGTAPLRQGVKLIDLLTRPNIDLTVMSQAVGPLKELLESIHDRKEEVIESTEVNIKYSGYINRERLMADKLTRLEGIRIKDKFNYDEIQSLSTEARQKLTKINPETIAQASRIPGVSPNDISVLLVLLGR